MADAVKEQVAHEVIVLQRTIKKLGEKNADGKYAVRLLLLCAVLEQCLAPWPLMRRRAGQRLGALWP
jgi:hypothetical protein